MSTATNPDRVYVDHQHRAVVRLEASQAETPAGPTPGIGAVLVNISPGGCCLRLTSRTLPPGAASDGRFPSVKLLHPDLDGTPIRGRIVWTREAPPDILLGIQFIHLRPSTLASIHAYAKTSRGKDRSS